MGNNGRANSAMKLVVQRFWRWRTAQHQSLAVAVSVGFVHVIELQKLTLLLKTKVHRERPKGLGKRSRTRKSQTLTICAASILMTKIQNFGFKMAWILLWEIHQISSHSRCNRIRESQQIYLILKQHLCPQYHLWRQLSGMKNLQ